jgi:transposase-like protein
MIVETTIHNCRRCQSSNIVKNGRNACGNPQYKCKDCGVSAVLKPKVAYSEERKAEILNAYQERPSRRGIERIFGMSRQTLARWLKKG